MKRALIEMEIDVQQMPLGKLSKNHLMEGYKVLSEIQELIKQGNAPKAKFVGKVQITHRCKWLY